MNTPEITPVVDAAATPEALLVQVPPLTVSVSVSLAPRQMRLLPPMLPESARGFTVMVAVAFAVPHAVVTT